MVKQYSHVFGPVSSSRHAGKTHALSVIQLIPLQEVFVQALSRSAYSRAKADLQSFEDWLCQGQRVLRQHSIYTLDAQDGPDTLTYKLIMTEPVRQGYAQKSQTSFTLLPPPEEPRAINGYQVLLSPSLPDDAPVEFDDDDDEDLEIGESFLASSLIPQPSSYPQRSDSPTIRMSYLAHEFTAMPSSMPSYSELDDYTMYVRTVDLPKVGVLDGDWVSANTSDAEARMRLTDARL